jgi:hypothetical protein
MHSDLAGSLEKPEVGCERDKVGENKKERSPKPNMLF